MDDGGEDFGDRDGGDLPWMGYMRGCEVVGNGKLRETMTTTRDMIREALVGHFPFLDFIFTTNVSMHSCSLYIGKSFTQNTFIPFNI